MKNKNNHHTTLTRLLAYAMGASVILSHTHMTDVVALSYIDTTMPNTTTITKVSTSDVHTKAIGDLHHHIDKTSVKHASTRVTPGARQRQLQPTSEDVEADSITQAVYDFCLKLGVVLTLASSVRSSS